MWLFNVSRAGGAVEGYAEGCSKTSERQGSSLRVMSLNILHGFPRFRRLPERLDAIADEIRRQDVDIVCLQEVPWTLRLGNAAKYLSKRTGFNYLYLRANGNRWAILFEEGEAILSRYPLRDVVSTELEPRAGLFQHRVVLGATATTPWGDVRIFVTHLSHNNPQANYGQVLSLLDFVGASGENTAIIAGDFNAVEDSPQIKTITRQWVDTYRIAHPGDKGFTCCVDDLSAGPNEPLEKRIDYIFLAPGSGPSVEVKDVERILNRPISTPDGWLWASDHIGLLLTIQIKWVNE